jgi:4'-phosphopantetheinyl transferase
MPKLLIEDPGASKGRERILSAGRDEIHLWRTNLDEAAALDSFPYLSADEWERAKGFRYDIHRNRFIAGRSFLRRVLAKYTGVNSSGIIFLYNAWGKPSLQAEAVQFNAAHSESEFLLAISQWPVGVDIEKMKPLEDLHLIAQSVFSQDELRRWNELSEAEKSDAFYKIWTRKEALLKGIGRGITEYCSSISVFFSETISALPSGVSPLTWHVRDWKISPGIRAAIATPLVKAHVIEQEFDLAEIA